MFFFLFSDPVIQYTALVWLREFVQISGSDMMPFASGVLTSVLPCFSYDDEVHRSISEVAKGVNSALMKLVTMKQDSGKNDTPWRNRTCII